MPVSIRDPGLRRALSAAISDGHIDAQDARRLLDSARDVRGPTISLTPAQVLSALERFQDRLARDPALKARILASPFPSQPAAQLDWALAYQLREPKVQDPLWNTATNDASSAVVAYLHGVVEARLYGLPVDDSIETQLQAAETELMRRAGSDPQLIQRLQQTPMPADWSEQLQWAVAINYAWDADQLPQVQQDPRADAVVDLVGGIRAKLNNNQQGVLVRSARHTLEVDGDTRVFAVHTPPGPRPEGGWPTLLFFHGSYGGHAPEQTECYQALNAIADQQGFQIVYPVGTPQDRHDVQTGRGMLNWEPVGTGPGGSNDRFVHELLNELIEDGEVNATQVHIAGHSQGGFYVSGLVASYPQAFASATIFGAGTGSVASRSDFARLERATPLLLYVGENDIHLPIARDLAGKLQGSAYGSALCFEQPAGRGHEVLPVDYQRMFAHITEHRSYADSTAGTLDGSTGPVLKPPVPAQVFRPFIDLRDPPLSVQQDPRAYQTLTMLAQNPYLNLDNDFTRVTVEEWKQALQYLHTWPQSMQQAISALRGHFVLAPPPQGPVIDLTQVPGALWSDPDATAAVQLLTQHPAFDLDGYPGLISERELLAAEQVAAQLDPRARRGLLKLRALLEPSAPPPTTRSSHTSSCGAKIEVYPGSEAAVQRAECILDGLAAHPAFAQVLSGINVVVSPPGHGLEAIAGLEDYTQAEGVASAMPDLRITDRPFVAIRHDSLSRWDLGLTHELIHLLHHNLPSELTTRISQVWQSLRRPDAQDDPYANHFEMMAFFGQWYLAGYGHVIQQSEPDLHALLHDVFGDTLLPSDNVSEDTARVALSGLLEWFRSGQAPWG